MVKIRLQRYLAQSAITSRRKAEELISCGKVYVNGEKVTSMGFKVSNDDIVEVDGQRIHQTRKKIYIMLNKPGGYVTTVKDQFSRKTVIDLLPDLEERVYPVGRLDYDSSGLIFMTNDGDFANFLMHPKNEVTKTYAVSAKGDITDDIKIQLENGVDIGGYITEKARIDNVVNSNGKCSVEISITEGKNRQVRKMFDAIGIKIYMLQRIAIGPVKIGDLK